MFMKVFDTECQALEQVTRVLQSIKESGRTLKGRPVVFDIDDTIIDSMSSNRNPPLCLYWRACGLLGLSRYIVTARPDVMLEDGSSNRVATEQQLAEHGLTEYEALYLMPADQSPDMQAAYKQDARRAIVEATGSPILVNIGDQWSDMGMLADYSHPFGIRRPKTDKTYVGMFDDTTREF